MGKGNFKRDKVVQDRFCVRIALNTSNVGPTKTEVTIVSESGLFDVLSFRHGPPHSQLERSAASFADFLSNYAGRAWTPDATTAPSVNQMALQNAAGSLFRSIFRDDDRERHMRLSENLAFYLRDPNLRIVRFGSNVPGIPLDALYYGSAKNFDPYCFLGFRAPVVHEPEFGNERSSDIETPSMGFLGTRHVRSVGVRDKDSIFEVLGELTPDCSIHEHTPLLDSDAQTVMHSADFDALFRVLGQPRSVWHITSHMRSNAGQKFFVLDNDLEVRPDDLDGRRPETRQFLGEPLIFLSLCAGSTPDLVGNNFPANLHALKAGGVIATHCLVNERFATQFAGRFYRHAWGRGVKQHERLSVAESLFRARRESFSSDGSLASLCYSFHAVDDFTISRPPSLAAVERAQI